MKKNNVPVMERTDVDTEVKLSLTKDDLTNMIIEDQQELLENRFDEVQRRYKNLQDQLEELHGKYRDNLLKLGKKRLSKYTKAFEKISGAEVDCSIYDYANENILKDLEFKYTLFVRKVSGCREKKEKSDVASGECVPFMVSVEVGLDPNNPISGSLNLRTSYSLAEIHSIPVVYEIVETAKERQKEIGKASCRERV